jgi:hypothetical protein
VEFAPCPAADSPPAAVAQRRLLAAGIAPASTKLPVSKFGHRLYSTSLIRMQLL